MKVSECEKNNESVKVNEWVAGNHFVLSMSECMGECMSKWFIVVTHYVALMLSTMNGDIFILLMF